MKKYIGTYPKSHHTLIQSAVSNDWLQEDQFTSQYIGDYTELKTKPLIGVQVV